MSEETKETKELVSWEEALAQKAAEQAAQRAALASGPKFLSFKGGILGVDKVNIPDNKLEVIVLTFIAENAYYKGRFDPTQTQSPLCSAVYTSMADMRPADTVKEKQAEVCEDCPHFKWGSDPLGGRGKACKQRYRIAIIPAGATTEQELLGAEMRMAVLPVTSGKDFESFSSKCEMILGRPMFGCTAMLSVVPDAKTQFKVNLEPTGLIAGELMPAVLKRIEEAEKAIKYEYAYEDDHEPEPEPAPRKGLKK